jgi:hypothetical protein
MNLIFHPLSCDMYAIDKFSLFSTLQVSWVRRKDDQLHLITFGSSIYISDSRYSLEFKEPNDWQLHIQYVNERDEGQFECQINTSPPLILTVHLEVIGEYSTVFKTSHRGCYGENWSSPPPHLFIFYYTSTRASPPPAQFNLRFYDIPCARKISIERRKQRKDIKSWVLGILCVEISFSFNIFDDAICVNARQETYTRFRHRKRFCSCLRWSCCSTPALASHVHTLNIWNMKWMGKLLGENKKKSLRQPQRAIRLKLKHTEFYFPKWKWRHHRIYILIPRASWCNSCVRFNPIDNSAFPFRSPSCSALAIGNSFSHPLKSFSVCIDHVQVRRVTGEMKNNIGELHDFSLLWPVMLKFSLASGKKSIQIIAIQPQQQQQQEHLSSSSFLSCLINSIIQFGFKKLLFSCGWRR